MASTMTLSSFLFDAPVASTPVAAPAAAVKRVKSSASAKSSGTDRFIANRNSMDLELSNFHLLREASPTATGAAASTAESVATSESPAESARSPMKRTREDLSQALFNETIESSGVLAVKQTPVLSSFSSCCDFESFSSLARVSKKSVTVSSMTSGALTSAAPRVIPQTPASKLDAPALCDDFFQNVLDWNNDNLVAVALTNEVYVWNASSGSVSRLVQLAPGRLITSLRWSEANNYLAVGTFDATVALFDVNQGKQIRHMASHRAASEGGVPALSWRDHILTSADCTGAIHNSDVRSAQHLVGQYTGHRGPVYNVMWSPDGSQLASGGLDNVVNVWDGVTSLSSSTPALALEGHVSTVKAMAWAPNQPNRLVSGGGLHDRQICVWNTNNGALLNKVDSGSQVSALLWSKNHNEIISSHGLPHNKLTIWNGRNLKKITDLPGHAGRVLHMAASPDGETVVSAGNDESLLFWKCFAPDQQQQKSKTSKAAAVKSMMKDMIR